MSQSNFLLDRHLLQNAQKAQLENYFKLNLKDPLGFLGIEMQHLFRVCPPKKEKISIVTNMELSVTQNFKQSCTQLIQILIFTQLHEERLQSTLNDLAKGDKIIECLDFNPELLGLNIKETEASPIIDKHLKDEEIFIRENGWLKRLFIKEISWIKLEGAYTHIKCSGRMYTVRSTSKQVLMKLPSNLFFQAHKSYYVNVNKIDAFNRNSLKMDAEIIPVGRSFYKALLDVLPHLEL